jgi:hypothetical protein
MSESFILKLGEKLKTNLNLSVVDNSNLQDEINLLARSVAALGEILSTTNLAVHQKDLCKVFDEVFADAIISVYNAGAGLDNSAQIILRRSLDLGVGIVYMWDQPVHFWSWKSHDGDLNFNDMIEYLSKESFKTFLNSLHGSDNKEELVDFKEFRRVYRDLSNTVHGKIHSHETRLPDRYNYNSLDWNRHLGLTKKVLLLLLSLFQKRFYNDFNLVTEKMTALKTLL